MHAALRHAPILFTVATALLGATPGTAQPSFDCRKATMPAEKLICASPDLSYLDERLAQSYTAAVGELGMAGRCLRIDQTRWLREVRNVCRDEACLWQAYHFRLGELNPFQPGITYYKDAPKGLELVAAVPPGERINATDAPENLDPKPMRAEGTMSEEGGSYVLTAAKGAHYVVQNFYFNEATIRRFNEMLVAAGERGRFRVSGYRAARPGQNIFEPRRCILIHRLPR